MHDIPKLRKFSFLHGIFLDTKIRKNVQQNLSKIKVLKNIRKFQLQIRSHTNLHITYFKPYIQVKSREASAVHFLAVSPTRSASIIIVLPACKSLFALLRNSSAHSPHAQAGTVYIIHG